MLNRRIEALYFLVLVLVAFPFSIAHAAGGLACQPASPNSPACAQVRVVRHAHPVSTTDQYAWAFENSPPGYLYFYSYTVLPSLPTILQDALAYDPFSCTVVSLGSWAVNSQPQSGNVFFDTVYSYLGNGDCPTTQFPFAAIGYTWTSTNVDSSSDNLAATWSSTATSDTYSDNFKLNLAAAKVTNVDLSNQASPIAISIPQPTDLFGSVDAAGTLEFDFVGTNSTVVLSSPTTYAPGSYLIAFDRTQLTKDIYSSLIVKWNASNPAVGSTYTPASAWNVLGTVRYSQYNTPAESVCQGTPITEWLVDSTTSCDFAQITLDSTFASQVNLNGIGASLSYGLVQTAVATSLKNPQTCKGKYPTGATLQNTYLQVPTVTGACNQPLIPNSSVATFKGSRNQPPTDPNYKLLRCGSGLQLVNIDYDTNFGADLVEDSCPACNANYNGTQGHIDSYSSNIACSSNSVGDLGNFWTYQTN